MIGIRKFLFLGALLLPLNAMAAVTDVNQQGDWTLRTSSSAEMTKDYFCASEGKFERGFTMMMAQNILGQTSIILNWPGFDGATNAIVPIRITADGKALRDVQANLKSPELLVIPMGWDSDGLHKLANAKRLNFETSKVNVQYDIKDNDKAFARLNSCTASLIDRLPVITDANNDVSKVLEESGLKYAKRMQVPGENDGTENFLIDGAFGGSEKLSKDKGDVAQRMLQYVDQLELLCRAQFSSELGGPMPISDGEISTAEAKCDAPHTGTFTALAFVNKGGNSRVYYFEGDKDKAQQLRTLRDMVVKHLK